MQITEISQQSQKPFLGIRFRGSNYQTQKPASEKKSSLSPITREEFEKIVRFAKYQDLLTQAEKAGISANEYIEMRYKDGSDLSKIKIDASKRTMIEDFGNGNITIKYDNNGREISSTNTIQESGYILYDGTTVNKVKSESVKTYPNRQYQMTLRQDGDVTQTGTYTGDEVLCIYAKDETGRVYKCQELKYIRLDNEPKISEVTYYNSDGSIKDKDTVFHQ